MNTMVIEQYEEAALAFAPGHVLHEARFVPERNRVVLSFCDPGDEVADLLKRHRQGCLEVCSLNFTNALRQAKAIIYEARPQRTVAGRAGSGGRDR